MRPQSLLRAEPRLGVMSAPVLRSEAEVRRALEGLKRSLRMNETATIEVSEDVLEFTVGEAIRRGLSVVDAYEKEGSVAVVVERRHE